MGLFDFFFAKGAEPEPEANLGSLGHVRWSEDDESWCGSACGTAFYLEYDRSSSMPLPALVAFAQAVLVDTSSLQNAVAKAKLDYLRKQPEYTLELSKLVIDRVYFSIGGGTNWASCQLGYGEHGRFWVIELEDGVRGELGFDT
ncbi:hypothetical protein ACW7G0_13945 [Lysobacter sp. A286]